MKMRLLLAMFIVPITYREQFLCITLLCLCVYEVAMWPYPSKSG
jgi:hypothetical protein